MYRILLVFLLVFCLACEGDSSTTAPQESLLEEGGEEETGQEAGAGRSRLDHHGPPQAQAQEAERDRGGGGDDKDAIDGTGRRPVGCAREPRPI